MSDTDITDISIEDDILERAQHVLRDALDSKDERLRVSVAKEVWKAKFLNNTNPNGITVNLDISGLIKGMKKMKEIGSV
jgi:hypothetical protein